MNMILSAPIDHESWLQYGWEMGYCGPPVCYVHDGLPMSMDEDEEFCEGSDPCIHIVRMYDDHIHRLAIESNDSPTNWRASNMGWTRE